MPDLLNCVFGPEIVEKSKAYKALPVKSNWISNGQSQMCLHSYKPNLCIDYAFSPALGLTLPHPHGHCL